MVKRAAGRIPFLLRLDPRRSQSLFRQIYEELRSAILEGRLKPGARLPSTRTLSEDLGVSRNTVLEAFEQLYAEGFLETRVGSGTRVVQTGEEIRRIEVPKSGKRVARARSRRISRRGTAIARCAVRVSLLSGRARPFRVGTPALAEFPFKTWERLQSRHWMRMDPDTLDYSETAGQLRLRQAIASYACAARGVHCEAEQVLVVAGSQQALDLAGRVLLDAGDDVWIENPGYLGARGAWTSAGARLVPVPVDEEGLRVTDGIRHAPGARLAYVSPSHQFPLGVTMSLERRLALLQWAERSGAWILEDDYDSEFRYDQRPLCSLQGLDTGGRVLYVGTLSKVLFPGLRLGYLIVPPDLVDAFCAARQFSDGGAPVMTQLVLADFMHEGHFERHIRRMRNLYRERRDALVDAVARHLGGILTLTRTEGGMHMVGWLDGRKSDRIAARRAAENGVDVLPLSAFDVTRRRKPGLLLGYPAFTPGQIEEAIERLARALGGDR
jgi:GntR family transcriptional regulator/MocR family aminotransferase